MAPTINFIKNNVDVETAEKNQVEKAAKTKPNAESKLAINTWAHTLKIKIPNKSARYHKNNVDVETAEKDQVVKAAKTKRNAKSKLAINTWALKIKIPNKFARCQGQGLD